MNRKFRLLELTLEKFHLLRSWQGSRALSLFYRQFFSKEEDTFGLIRELFLNFFQFTGKIVSDAEQSLVEIKRMVICHK